MYLLLQIHDTYYLVAIVDNDFVHSEIFTFFHSAIQAQSEGASKRSRGSTPDVIDVDGDVTL
jgi:hypothetical protein